MNTKAAAARGVWDKATEMASSSRVPRCYMQHMLAWLAVTAAAQPSLSVPSSVPSNASAVVDPDFAGFAFEQASLWNYALDADGNANEFSINLFAAITDRTGGKPLIRLGGTSYVCCTWPPDDVEFSIDRGILVPTMHITLTTRPNQPCRGLKSTTTRTLGEPQ